MGEESQERPQDDEERRDEETSGDSGSSSGSSGGDTEDLSATSAPSIGPNTVVDRSDERDLEKIREESPKDPDTGLREIDLDAMGNDKRRSVVDQSYGPSLARQATLYGLFLALVIGLVIGGRILISNADQPPAHNAAAAPWANHGAPQHKPRPIE